MSKFKKHFWMSTILSGAMALTAGPAFGGPVIPSTSQQLDPNMPKHGMAQMQKDSKDSETAQKEGVSSMGKLQQADAHTLWLLHKINQGEIAAGQLAQAKSQNDKVKSLADDLVKDHKSLDEKVMKLAKDNDLQFEGAAATTETGTGGAGLSGQSSDQSSSADQSKSDQSKAEDQAGTGGSGTAATPGTTTGSMKMNGDHAPASPSEQQGQQGSKDVSKTGGSSTVEEVPNTGTGGSGSAGAQAQSPSAGVEAQGQAGTQQGSATAGTAAQAEAPTEAGKPMKLSSADRSFLEKSTKQLQHLSKLQGSKFDREFLHAQIRDHQKAMSLLHSAKPTNDDVKKLVADAMPGMQKHEKDAREALKSLSEKGVGGAGEAGTSSSSSSYAPNKTSTQTGSSAEQQGDQNAAVTGGQENGSTKSGSAAPAEGGGVGGGGVGSGVNTGGTSDTGGGGAGGSSGGSASGGGR